MSARNGHILTPQQLAQQPTVVQQIVQPIHDVQLVALIAVQLSGTVKERVIEAQDLLLTAFATHARVTEGLAGIRRAQQRQGE